MDLSYSFASLTTAASSALLQCIPASPSGVVECFWPLDSGELVLGDIGKELLLS